MKILLLEDDDILNELLCSFLEDNGYQVTTTYDGLEAENELSHNKFDLLILDVNVPGINGFNLLKNFRALNINTPAIYITSLDQTEDIKKGFLSGCDDYLKKPFVFEELNIRIENIKRLYRLNKNQTQILAPNIIYNYSNSSLLIENQEHILTKKESEILEYFLKNRQRAISIEELASNLWSYSESPTDSTVRTYIKNIRKLLGESIITTIKGVGYRFN